MRCDCTRIEGVSRLYTPIALGGKRVAVESKKVLTVQSRLDPDELLLWVGSPNPAHKMVLALPTLAIGIVCTSAVLVPGIYFWLQIQSSSSGVPFGQLYCAACFGLPFFIIGLIVGLMSMTAPIIYYWEAERECYAVTNRRVMFIPDRSVYATNSYGPGEIGDIKRLEHSNGSGTLIFTGITDENGRQLQLAKFIGIPNVRRVEGILREWLV